MPFIQPERVLFVHAHPDDETISTGTTIATLVASGAEVSVLTCTRGERGDVIPQELKYLLASEDALGQYRVGELHLALKALGVTEHRILGEADARWEGRAPRTYRDSGMRWGAIEAQPLETLDTGSLAAAELGEVAADIAAVLIALHPDVVVSYDADGGYGHPDHIRAHDATRTAAQVIGVPFYVIDGSVTQGSAAREGSDTLTVNDAAGIARKRAALAVYGTQLTVNGDTFSLSSGGPIPVGAPEHFRRWREPETGFGSQPLANRIATSGLGVILGLLTGLMGTVIHQASITVAAVPVPWGVIVAILITASLLVGLRLVFATRIVPAFAAIGIIAAQLGLILASPGGSVLLPANPVGYLWTFAPVVIAAIVLAWPQVLRSRLAKIETVQAAKGADPT